MKISTPSSQPRYTPLEHIATAERLGYDRARLFATPHEPDVWMMLALAAERTTTISPGPGVLVPSLRPPMVNASTTAALAALAGRGLESPTGSRYWENTGDVAHRNHDSPGR